MFRTRKIGVVAAALAVTASLGLAACGGDDSGDSGDGKTLRLWHYEGPNSAMGIAWAKAIEDFKASHPASRWSTRRRASSRSGRTPA